MIRIATKEPQFKPGQIVSHRRYGYRGVVVAHDPECRAPSKWYQTNQTQPLKQQPWYHVLVHGTATVTYAAEDNLVADEEGLPIEHPLLEVYFGDFSGSRYVRNEQTWKGW